MLKPVHFISVLLLASTSFAQFPDLQFLVGTSIEDGSGKKLAYLRWMAPDPQVLVDQQIAIFKKTGNQGSAALYETVGVCQLNRQPATIRIMLSRGAKLGDDLPQFESDLDKLFDNIGIDAGLKLEEKVAAVIGVAQKDPEIYSTLTFFAQAHPAMGLCLGQGWMLEIEGVTTFEARRCPDTFSDLAQDCDRVVGRVTIDPNNVMPLPPPGAPVEVAETSAKGHLSVRLRWSTPDALRRENLLQFGFNLYRVEKGFAEANGWNIAPPPDAFSNYDPAFVKLINDLPILPNPNLTDVQAADTNDTETLFVIDDNNVFNGGAAFSNGDAFYYFVTARDVLGRDGQSSPGTLVMLCDRIPPDPPKNLRVRNVRDWAEANPFNRQRLEVSWDVVTPERGEVPVSYGVFRWDNARGPGSATNDVIALSHLVSPPLVHDNGATRMRFVDDGLGAPNPVTGTGKTWWYTVRALDDGACGGNMGPDSAPAFGVLRDRGGPDAPTGSLDIICATPRMAFQPPIETEDDPFDSEAIDPTLHVLADCIADPSRVEWVQFSYGPPSNPTNVSPRIYLVNNTRAAHLFAIDRDPPGSGLISRTTYCRSGGVRGGVSPWTAANLFGLQSAPKVYRVHFDTFVSLEEVAVSADCRTLWTTDPGSPTERPHVNPPELTIDLQPDTEEWRVYRRIDEGPLGLIAQGFDSFADTTSITVTDTNLPVNAALVCYFAQLADEHGNISPLTRIECVETASRIPLPTPMLIPIEAAGSETNQQMRISWFCSPEPVEYFEVWVKAKGARFQDTASTDATSDPRPSSLVSYKDEAWKQYETRRIGVSYQDGPIFDYTVNIIPGWQYIVQVRGINRSGEATPFSVQEGFTWALPTPPIVQAVPWPARAMPPVEADAIAKVTATTKSFGSPELNQVRMAAIRIGEYLTGNPDGGWEADYNADLTRDSEVVLHIAEDEGEFTLYEGNDGKSVFPCVVYRYQVANGFFPEVSGDVYQVTPLIAEETAMTKDGSNLTIWSPFLDLSPLSNGSPQEFGVFIQDTQPVLRNAAYKYLIVRFKDNGEIDKVMPTNPFTVQ